MDAQDTPITKAVGRDTTTHTRLRGRWPWIARVLWIAFAVLALGIYFAAVPILFNWRLRGCLAGPCAPSEAQQLLSQLQRAGLTAEFITWYFSLTDILPAVGLIAVALLIFWRRSDDWLALLLSLNFVGLGVTFSPAISALVAERPFWLWAFAVLQTIAFGLLPAVFYLFPDGRFVPRWAAILVPVWPGLMVAVYLSATGSVYLYPPLFVVLTAAIGSCAAAQVYRYFRASSLTQRQQTKWVVAGFAATFLGTFIVSLPGLVFGSLWENSLVGVLYQMIRVPVGTIMLLVLPLTLTISFLRYRLWDVDFVINRGLVYGGLTVLLGGIFAGGFFGLRAALGSILGSGSDLVAIGVPAAAVAGLFNPARRWLRAFVDRRFYGIQVDYQKAQTPTPSPVASSGMLRTALGAYEGLEPIGRGGMAEIYKARHPTLDKTVAIKVLPPALAREADFRRRFEREAKVVAALKHPNIVQVFDFGEAEGTHYMVMEYVAGRDLGDVIREAAPLPVERVRSIVEDIAGALDYAHTQGLVHRDVKPSNVMVEAITSTGPREKSERAVLMDFGIARILTGGTRLTATGMMGTFDYIAPEQIQAASDVDGRADIYSLGVMAYQMLTGRLPFETTHPAALLIAHLNQPCPDPRETVRDLPESTASAILRAMSKKPEQRFKTAGEFVAALDQG